MKACTLIAAASLVLGAAPMAHASSIVHVRDSNVWLVDPDSGRRHQVTTEGTANDAFHHPSQADDGTIFASQRWVAHLLRQNGERIRAAGGATEDGEISPDGSTLPSVGVTTGCTSSCGGAPPGAVYWVTHFGPEREYGWRFSAWADAGRAVMLTNGVVGLFGPDGIPDNGATWFGPDDVPEAGDWTPAGGGKLALVTSGPGGAETLRLYRAAGAAEKPVPECSFGNPDGKFEDPTWSPDGTRLAWEGPEGIEVATIASLDDCEALEASLLVPGGKDPHWGPAAINPGPRAVRDGDGDGVAAPRDCDDRNAAIKPGAVDVPGNGVDEDCSGADAQVTQRTTAAVSLDAAFRVARRTTAVRRLRLRDVPAGSRVTLRCSVRRCLRGPATVEVQRATASLDLRSRLRRRALPAGAVLEVVVTRAGEAGRAWRYRFRADRSPRRSELCMPPSATRPRAC